MTQQSDELKRILADNKIGYVVGDGDPNVQLEKLCADITSYITQQTQEAVEPDVHEAALLLIQKYKKLTEAQSEVIATLRSMVDAQLKANTNKEGQDDE